MANRTSSWARAGILIVVLLASCSRPAAKPPVQPAADAAANRSAPPSTPPTPGDTTDSSQPTSPPTAAPPGSPRPASQPGAFVRLPAAWTQVDFLNKLDLQEPRRRLYHSGFVCGGVATGDVTGDGLPDLLLVSGPGPNRLYRNEGDCRFTEITSRAHVEGGDAWGTGAAMIDIDNDGDLDIYVCNYDAPNQLYVNDGAGEFTESAAAWKLDLVDACLMPTFVDYDRDGDLDVYIVHNRYYRDGGRPARPPWGTRDGKPYVLPEFERYFALQQIGANRFTVEEYGRADRLLRQEPAGSFQDVTDAAGIDGHGFGLSATWWDANQDGWPDLYVCNDFNDPDRMYRNNGDGTFTDVLVETLPHTPWFAMGSDAADVNNDGLLDLLAVDMSATNHYKQKTTMGAMSAAKLAQVAGPPPQLMRNALYVNTGTGRFLEAAYLADLGKTDWSWAAKFADFDHDGRVDLFVSNGAVRSFNDSDVPFDERMLIGRTYWDLYAHLPTRPEQNLAWKNSGDLRFEDVSQRWGLDHVGMSYGTSLADLDGDQDLDLIVVNMDEPISIYRNDVAPAGGLTVRLQGTRSNRYGVGAWVEWESASLRQVRYLVPASGFQGSHEPVVHFGSTTATPPARVTVRWPSGQQQVLEGVTGGQRMRIIEPDEAPEVPAASAPTETAPPPLFTRHDWLAEARHQEAAFDDFALQSLLPNRLSQHGPGMAVGDVDGDGDEDLYQGGAAGAAGLLLLQASPGTFEVRAVPAFARDADCEDLGCLFLDLDADGDLDLYVVSGGVEAGEQPERYCDRIYQNDGKGGFTRVGSESFSAPPISGGPVAAADFDRDGDLDLFVGGRLTPGDYPLSPPSVLWRNDQGRLVDVTVELAPGLREAGMVTGAIWSDIDADGWNDLLLTREWGTVGVFHNREGRLQPSTINESLAQFSGWWNGIAGGDLDSDGDTDFVVTNFGWNTKYHASHATPALLYYGDFEHNGKMQLVEAEYEQERLVPIRGRSCSSQAMPSLRNRFQTYHDFALADLPTLYSDQCLQESHRFAATTLESGILRNQGDGRFAFEPLPRLAQIAPGFGVVVADWTGDGQCDILMAQNFFGAQPETGPMDGGIGILLAGQPDGSFMPVPANLSGVIVPGDAKGVVRADLDQDGSQELVVTRNSAAPIVLRMQPAPETIVRVRLRGTPGNAEAVGARVVVTTQRQRVLSAEVSSGGGYLSQSSRTLEFRLPGQDEPTSIHVRWPGGRESTQPIERAGDYTLEMPTGAR